MPGTDVSSSVETDKENDSTMAMANTFAVDSDNEEATHSYSLHTSDMDAAKISGNIDEDVPVKSTRIWVGRSIEGFGLSPGITKEQRLEKNAFAKFDGDLAGEYYPLTGMVSTARTDW